jgi:hypothetical protein
MSPDEMLRAYAERKKSMAGLKGVISYPMPAASSATPSTTNNNMRVLYNAATGTVSPTNTGNAYDGVYDPPNTGAYDGVYDASDMGVAPGPRPTTDYAPSEYSAGSAAAEYSHAVANQYAFGHHPNGSIGDEDDVHAVFYSEYEPTLTLKLMKRKNVCFS